MALLRVSGLAGAGGIFFPLLEQGRIALQELVLPCKSDLGWELLECLIALEEIQGKEDKGSKSTGENIK